nr:probable trehalase [Tanacetum cinerariifolium]
MIEGECLERMVVKIMRKEEEVLNIEKIKKSNEKNTSTMVAGSTSRTKHRQSLRDYLILSCDCVGVGDVGLFDYVMVPRQKMAKGIVLNPIDLIDRYGYVLNGAWAYYTNISETIFCQPPLLCSMVVEVYMRTNDMDLVKKALSTLIKEHKFWNSDTHNVAIEDDQGLTHNLSRYYAMWNQPRPESFTIDTTTADKLTNDCQKTRPHHTLLKIMTISSLRNQTNRCFSLEKSDRRYEEGQCKDVGVEIDM